MITSSLTLTRLLEHRVDCCGQLIKVADLENVLVGISDALEFSRVDSTTHPNDHQSDVLLPCCVGLLHLLSNSVSYIQTYSFFFFL